MRPTSGSATLTKAYSMKVLILILAVVASCSLAARGQGSVLFENIAGGVNAPVYMSDRVTPLSGPQFRAELLGGPSAGSLTPIAATGFLTGAAYAGYFNGGLHYIDDVDLLIPVARLGLRCVFVSTAFQSLRPLEPPLPRSADQSAIADFNPPAIPTFTAGRGSSKKFP